jgi:serine/threonine protein kinase
MLKIFSENFGNKHFHLENKGHLNNCNFYKHLGDGSYGNIDIYKCVDCHDNVNSVKCNCFFVVKRLKRESKKCYKAMLNEYTIGLMLNHKNVRGIVDIDSIDRALIYEYIPDSIDLFEFTTKKNQYKSVKNITLIINGIRNGIKHIHNNKIAHLDLKLENIIVSLDKNNQISNVKLIDFGSAIVFELYNKKYLIKGVQGTLAYAAPEQFTDNLFEGDKADIWAFGLIMYDTIFNGCPWRKATVEDYNYLGYLHNESLIFNSRFCIPDHFKFQILSALNIDPSKRIF